MSKHSTTNDFDVKEVCLPLHTEPTTALEKPMLSLTGVPGLLLILIELDSKKIKLVDRSYRIRKWALLSYPKAADTRVGSQATTYNIIFRRTIFVNDVVRSSHHQLVRLQILLPNQLLYACPKCLHRKRIQLSCDQ
ncbi:hypothetical protein M9H77_29412 [Catharanthus roseus]|uniref:Uncharacterized protein n=1 Tax=Catharanthus roseus TaxID=4058 RepID=A0ACB9ZUB9_CATRO|nr:hypothetical protein M9H77_00492 [Catharanthus roseus]KAI5652225.1 hypothetical protein M9H77_29412 [Catharanthus roseus]